ncbi:hypothetical protein EHS13_10760 [Paenibacillus psychroresistens]|uniref:Copper amine oxidase N-terminal domain-containing protein n=1 Tax=Paenibacillus psychroresistens TaxID=1778678 RepID=A0A6B8RGU9_9BACL|nr:hypothetical protein [Paenibacillus psychroresistens]QGQ95329.1 hypothetical protein EHS13_10760 [Paenibacillus psychroresistens]
MRKYIIGFMIGIALSISTVVFAANTIQAYLFPSRVLFHINDTVKEIDGSGDNAVINYNNKAYIPLRAFTDAMGATVTFSPSSSITSYLNKIDIYEGPAAPINTGLTLKDSEGYVTISNLKVVKDKNGNEFLTSGTIQINKDLTGKTIELNYSAIKENNTAASLFMYILNEDIDKPEPGDIRPFKTSVGMNDRKLESLSVIVHDTVKQYPYTELDTNWGDPVAIYFAPRSNFVNNGQMSLTEISSFSIAVANSSANNIIIQPYDLTFEVYKADANYQQQELVYSYKLPRATGTLGKSAGYSVIVPWNQRGTNGKFITAGKYAIRLKAPASLQYFKEGSNDIINYPLYLRTSGFGVEFK